MEIIDDFTLLWFNNVIVFDKQIYIWKWMFFISYLPHLSAIVGNRRDHLWR